MPLWRSGEFLIMRLLAILFTLLFVLSGCSGPGNGAATASAPITPPRSGSSISSPTTPAPPSSNIALDSISYINSASDSASFSVSGTCDLNGELVTILIDSAPASSPVGFICDGARFLGSIDTTVLGESTFSFEAQISDGTDTFTSTALSVVKDMTAPTFTVTTAATINLANYLSYTVAGTCSEDGTVILDIGGVATSGSCSGSSFSITGINVSTASDDTSLVITSDFNDLAGNSASQATTNVLKDTVAPVVSITTADDINTANELSYLVVGTCSEDGITTSLDVGSSNFTPSCAGGSFSKTGIDVQGQADSTSFAISISQTDSAGNTGTASTTVVKDTATVTVTINTPVTIDNSNETDYILTGTCSVNGTSVSVDIGGVSANPNCSSGVWNSGALDVSALADGTINITADHSTATQATATVEKDSAAPTVTISSAPDISSSNETIYSVSGTCAVDTAIVTVDIGGLSFTPTCTNGTYTTGQQDVSSLADSTGISVTADHSTATQASTTINKSTSTPTVSSLSSPSSLSDTVNLSWNLNDPGGFTIDDYEINYKVSGTSTWLTFSDGVSTNTTASVTGLNASTTYDFRVRVQYDTINYSTWSLTAQGTTQPDDPLFDSPYKAMNVGGATSSTVVAMEDNTAITLNDVALVTLNKGQTHTFTSTQFDVIDADKPIFTAGRAGPSGGGASSKGNIVWNPTYWAGKSFSFNATRFNSQKVHVYAIEDTDISIKQGATTVASASVLAGNTATLEWSVYGSYQVNSTGTVLAFHRSSNGGTSYADVKPLLPAHTEIIGFPSNSMRLTTNKDGTNYTFLHSNSTSGSGSINKSDVIQINPQGATTTLYRSDSLLLSADKEISGASFADSNGYCASAFMPTNLMKKKYAINVSADYVAFASKEAGTIDVLDSSDNVVQTLTLTRSGANPNAPYYARLGTTTAGYRFVATAPVAAWYQPNTDVGAGDEDETILYGSD